MRRVARTTAVTAPALVVVAAARGGRPVDTPQRLSLLVVADAVELEADRPPQQEPPPVLGAGATVEEEALEVGEAGVDDERLLLLQRQRRLGEAERVCDRQADRREAMTPARHVAEPVGAHMATASLRPQLELLFPQAPDPLMGHDLRKRHSGLALEHELDRGVVSLEQVLVRPAPGHTWLPQRDPYPRQRERDGEDEPGRDRVDGRRAEDDGDDPAENAEGQYRSAPGGHQTGTGVRASASATSSSAPSAAERASGARMSRWASTGAATALTSSGAT